jgi:hypothetical protein
MALTPAQLATLKAAIVADSELNAFPMNSDGAFAIAAALNQIASPEWIVWRTNVTRREVLQNGFDWTRLDNLSVGKARVWSDIFVDGEMNPSKPNVRAGIESVWVGTTADLAVRASVYEHCKIPATRIQAILSSGTGTNATPATMDENIDESFQLSFADVTAARQLP